MEELNKHWTEESTDDFLYKLVADFVRQLENVMDSQHPRVSQRELADRLGVTAARVSQVLNNPGNIGMKRCVELARALGLKVALIAYDDADATNVRGPVPAPVFERCWVDSGRPRDMFGFESEPLRRYVLMPDEQASLTGVRFSATKSNTAPSSLGMTTTSGTDATSRLEVTAYAGVKNG